MFNDRGYDTKPKCLIRIKDVYSAGNELKQRIKDKFKVLNKIARVGSEYLNLQEWDLQLNWFPGFLLHLCGLLVELNSIWGSASFAGLTMDRGVRGRWWSPGYSFIWWSPGYLVLCLGERTTLHTVNVVNTVNTVTSDLCWVQPFHVGQAKGLQRWWGLWKTASTGSANQKPAFSVAVWIWGKQQAALHPCTFGAYM